MSVTCWDALCQAENMLFISNTKKIEFLNNKAKYSLVNEIIKHIHTYRVSNSNQSLTQHIVYYTDYLIQFSWLPSPTSRSF